MSDYTQQILKVTVAQLCQTIGWNSIQTTPLELMSDILNKYIKEIATQTHRYAELYGRTEPNLDDVALAFKDMNVNIADLEEYVNNVDPVPCAIEVPKFPVQKDNHLNFLKPGSKEVVTRPVHIHEYLPPMYPEREDEEKAVEIFDTNAEPNIEVVSLPGDENEFSRKNDSYEQKHGNRPTEAETRYTREITSVMMTTSGFISPAREGKLPDAKAPIIAIPDLEKPPAKEPPSAAVGSLMSSSVNGTSVKSEKVKTEKIKTEKMKSKKKSLTAAVIQEKKRKKEKFKDNLHGKLSPMGPPPAKQMPSQAAPIYLPNDTPMSVVAEQQKIGKKPFMPKIPRKHKVKDPNKPPKPILDGKISKKIKKPTKTKNLGNVLDELFKVHQPTFPMALPGTVPMDVTQARNDKSIDLTDQPIIPQSHSSLQLMPDQLPPFNPNINQQPANFMFEGKLSTDTPDKRKLNIIKRISSKNKEDVGKQGLPLPPHINLPETSIFPVDDAGMSTTSVHSPSLSAHLQVPPKKTPKKSPTMSAKKLMKQLAADMPINMTVPKPGENADFPMGLTPKQLKAAARKQMKALKEPKEKKVRVKKEKLKAKDKKLKEQPWPMTATDLSMTGPSSLIPPQPIPQRKSEPIPPILQNLYDQHLTQQFANHLRGSMGNMGNLRGAEFMQNFPMYPWSGPGLIPGNPLFPNFPLQPRQRMPFPLPNFEMFGAFPRLKRPHIEKPEPEPMAMPINFEMAQCNVAPLVPASLKLEDISTPIPSNPQQNNYFPPAKSQFPSSTSISLVPGANSHQNMKSKPLTPEPRIENQTIDLTDDPYDDELPPASKRIETPSLTISPLPDNMNQTSHMQFPSQSKQRRLSSSPRHVSSTFNTDDTQSLTDSLVDDTDNGSNAPSKDKLSKIERRKDKEHKKDKKDKEGKIKKKKDKKDKTKNKEKSEKRKEKEDKHKDKELKLKTKKEKREKRKEKELARVLCGMASTTPVSSGPSIDLGVSSSGSGRDSDSSVVPKLTLKLGTSPRPETPDAHRKITIKPIKKDVSATEMDIDENSITRIDSDQSREPSPELARFSALVTRPPKQKTPLQNDSRPYTPTYPRTKRDSFNYESDEESANILKEDHSVLPTQNLPSPVYLSRPKTPQLQQPQSPVPMQQHTFTSLVAPTVTTFPTDTVVMPSATQSQSRQSSYIDSDGNQVWICPACGRVDDGTPMIGCDGCDAWYHWVCVGIQVPPDANEDWYCRVCIAKKQEWQGGDKKKKRKKKDKKEH